MAKGGGYNPLYVGACRKLGRTHVEGKRTRLSQEEMIHRETAEGKVVAEDHCQMRIGYEAQAPGLRSGTAEEDERE